MIGLAVTAAAAFGAADYLGGAATARAGSVRRVLLVSEPVAALALLAAVLLSPGTLTAAAVGWGLAAGVAAGAGQALLYTALSRDAVGPGAPLCGVTSVAVPVLWAVVTGRPPGPYAWAGFMLMAAAVVALCGPTGKEAPVSAVAVAGGAGAAFGVYSILLGASPAGSSFWPVLVAHTTVTAAVIATFTVPGQRPARRDGRNPTPRLPAGSLVAMTVPIGVLEAVAAAAILVAARRDLAVAGAVAAIHPAATVLLARLIDRAPLGGQRTAGLVMSCAGVLVLARS